MKITIGRIDKAIFPAFELKNINIKIDSGAYTSSIHCSNIKEITVGNVQCITFTVLDSSNPLFTGKEITYNDYKIKLVKSSNGISEKRFLIKTSIIIFNQSYHIDLTLTERKNMKYPVLIGRKFLNKHFIIDTSLTNLSHKQTHKSK